MCAIVGIASTRPVNSRAWLSSGRDAMAHRGPDGTGEWWSPDGRVGLAHRRLAIIDLSPDGHQPMSRDGADVHLVFNGEIYNFVALKGELEASGFNFSTKTDTEVIIASYQKWGLDCLSRLKGMFSIALFDRTQDTLLLARDRAGEKPLFVYRGEGEIRFASELKGIFADPAIDRRLNPSALDHYLSMGYAQGNSSIIRKVEKVPPGHAMTFNVRTGASRTWRYWAPPPSGHSDVAPGESDASCQINELDRLLEASVSRQLVADVPVGVLLSGGVDSSLVAAMAVRTNPRIKTFTVTFPDTATHDEGHHASYVADYLGTEHQELPAENAGAHILDALAVQFDEPIGDSSMVPTFLLSQLIRQHCSVALGGDGGDELFGGYSHYRSLLRVARAIGGIPRPLRQSVSWAAEHGLPEGFPGRGWLQACGADFSNSLPVTSAFFGPIARASLLGVDVRSRRTTELAQAISFRIGPELADRAMRSDFANFLSEDILVKTDRASMLNSLELRAPFLDADLMDFAFARVQTDRKVNSKSTKIILKELAARVLPPKFDMVRKQGFSIPLRDWLKEGAFRERIWRILTDADCLFDKRAVRRLLDSQDRGYRNEERIFLLAMFELWRTHYRVSL